ncbi:hypothetical protein SISNIDRAFT_406449 [Sistotremastrum niveocremeum HHB9708]|uniref:Ribosomal RNA-processing protein 40 n=1 Tax=Sistotremastrum niveocremeum HHB9708 TaxID=1314777 RepID=A0A164YYJ3_9AGAM|nr:hypothetical protein SISNIDRAFT_406449 [Sistotremastrum niveocremeum HHB9708]
MSLPSAVLPGDLVPVQHAKLKLGPGLIQLSSSASSSSAQAGSSSESSSANALLSTKAGSLHHNPQMTKWWIESNAKRYVPAAQESVVGVVTGRIGQEGWRVDIGAAHQATLDALAFEGATKRNRPNLKVGSLVFARVSLAHKDMEPELECFDSQTHKAGDFGELKGGFMVKCSLILCRWLLDPEYYLLKLIGARFPLEVVVGVNGRVWISTSEPKQTIAIARCIEAADPEGGAMSESQVKSLFAKIEV